MIRIITERGRLTAKTLIGCFVFRKSTPTWESVDNPLRVEAVVGAKIRGVRMYLDFNPTLFNGTGGYVSTNAHQGDTEVMMVGSVRAVCDTLEEVALLQMQAHLASQQYHQFQQWTACTLANLNGVRQGWPR